MQEFDPSEIAPPLFAKGTEMVKWMLPASAQFQVLTTGSGKV